MTESLGRRGQVLVGVLITMLVLVIMVPALVFYVQSEVKQTMKQKRSTAAFYAASSGIDRALFKVKSSSTVFDDCLQGNMPAGYNGEIVYTDVTNGAYVIGISSTAVQKEIRVEARGRDGTATEHRTIVVLWKKDSVAAAVYAPSITAAGSAKIYWGPLMSLNSIVVQGSSNELYPRKLARGAITATGGGYPSRDTSSAAQNTDGLEWWSFNEPPGVPDILPVDLDYYKTAAKAEVGCPAGGNPSGSCYYTSDQNWDNHKSTFNRTYYFEGDAKFTGSKHFRGVMIIMDEFDMQGSGESGATYGQYTVSVPTTAYLEYQKNAPNGGDANCSGSAACASACGGGGNGASDDSNYNDNDDAERDDCCCHQYPGDMGTAVTEQYTFGTGCTGHGNAGGASTEKIAFKGFIYVRGNSKISGSTSIHGALLSTSGSFTGSGSFSMFYDDTLEIRTTGINITQTFWAEIPGKQF